MNFNTIDFLLIFFPVCIIVFYIVPAKFRIVVLLCESIVFYSYSGSLHLFLMLTSLIWGYFTAYSLTLTQNSKYILIAGIIYPLLVLFSFKYLSFSFYLFGQNIAEYQSLAIFTKYILPAGISFYTFQIISYVVDVYSNKIEYEKSFIKYGAYITFFPQLIAGPILRYSQIVDQFESLKRGEIKADYYSGIKYIAYGLFYKVFFADILFTFHDKYKLNETLNYIDSLYGVFSYSVIIYFDFWGYSLMAIGLAKIFGINLPKNFREPYKSLNPKQFWRKWHITLSQWLKDYIYIRLGGSNKYVRNIFIVFFLCGLWHGAGPNFVIWGLYHAFLVVIYHYFREYWDKLPVVIQIAVTFVLVSLGWPMFYTDAGGYINLMLSLISLNGSYTESVYSFFNWIYLLLAFLWIFFIDEEKLIFRVHDRIGLIRPIMIGILLFMPIIFLSYARTFIYFRF